MIKAAIFDMDGTLVDSEPTWGRVFNEIFEPLGIHFEEKDHLEFRGRSARENVDYLYAHYPWKGPGPDEVYSDLEAKMIEAMKNEMSLKEGVDAALLLCKEKKLHVAIASGSPMVIIDAVVDALEIREHFHHLYSAQFEPHGKPHPGVFIKVAEHFKVRPEECLVFEDSPSGVLAAKAAKMHCIAIPPADSKDNAFVQTADIIADTMTEFDEKMLASF